MPKSLPSHLENTNPRKRRKHSTNSDVAKYKEIAEQNELAKLCDSCRCIDFCKVLDLSYKDIQSTSLEGYLIAELGTRLGEKAFDSCDLCQILRAMIDDPAVISQKLQLRAYSAWGNTKTTGFKRLPDEVKSLEAPYLAIVVSGTSAGSCSITSTKRAYCTSIDECPRVFTPRIPSGQIDYATIGTWLQCCKERHRALCNRKESKVRPSRLIDCTTSPPSLVQAPQSAAYLVLSYRWGNKGHTYSASYASRSDATRSVVSPIILCPPQTISDAIIVTRELGYQYLWVDGYCIIQTSEKDKMSQVNIMDEIYGGAELTIVAAAGSHNNYGLPGVSTTVRKEWRPVVNLGNIQITYVEEHPQRLIRSTIWAQRAWTYQEALLSQRLLYFTEREVYFECHSMQNREAIQADLKKLHCRQGKLYAQLNIGLFLGKTSCPDSYIRSGMKFLVRFHELVRQYTMREMGREEDLLMAFAGIMKYLQGCKVPVYQLAGIPFLHEPDSREETHKSFLFSLLWTHCKSFPPRKRSPLPHPTRRHILPSWSWAGWKGEAKVIGSSSGSTGLRYKNFQPRSEITQIKMENGVQFDPAIMFGNPGAAQQGIPCALTMRVRLLRPESFSITFASLPPMCRITRKNDPPRLHPKWDPSRPPPPSRRGKRQPPRYFPGLNGKLYICKGPKVLTRLSIYFEENHFQVALIATSLRVSIEKGRRRNNDAVYFLVLEPKGDAFSRVGILIINESFATFGEDLLLDERVITIV